MGRGKRPPMKKNIVVVAALAAAALLTGTLSYAQAPAPAARAHRGGGMQKMADKLGLTDAQKAQMKSIALNARTQMKTLHTPGTPPSADMQAKMMAIRKSTRAQMMAVLTPAQREQMKQQMKQMRQQHTGQ